MKLTKHQFLATIRRLPGGALWTFVILQAWAALFGGLMLGAILLTQYAHLPWLAPNDWLFVLAILIQAFMVLSKLEKPHEVLTILLFHLVGLGMELFKTSAGVGSWSYPGIAIIHLGNVPLFSGFMYAAVGSYIARAWRVLGLRFTHYPPRKYTLLLAGAVYANFFIDHYGYDFRYLLFAAILVLFGRSQVSYVLDKTTRQMPLVVGFALIALVIWVAENVGTYTRVWLYPTQLQRWQPVGIGKVGSWYLLMVISFIMIDTLYYLRSRPKAK